MSDAFDKYLAWAEKEVGSWPEWRQTIMGGPSFRELDERERRRQRESDTKKPEKK